MTVTSARSSRPWLGAQPNAWANVRLFCFHHAGGGASLFRDWLRSDAFPVHIQVLPVQLPGREDRFRELAFRSMPPLIDALLASIGPYLVPPFALFGHSLGALVAFELARRLQSTGWELPAHLFLSAKRPPHLPRPSPLAGLPDLQLAAALRRLNGTPAELLEHRELLELVLPILRADLSVSETYPPGTLEPLDCPVSAFVGSDDPEAGVDEAWGWQCGTRYPLTVRVFEGDHFYLHGQLPAVQAAIAAQLERDDAH